jgi:hypothetical protein
MGLVSTFFPGEKTWAMRISKLGVASDADVAG